MFFNPTYLLFALPAMLFTMWAQWQVRNAYEKFAKIRNIQGLTGFQVAQVLMRNEGLGDVRIEGIEGHLTDHYVPGERVMRLSQGSASTPSVAAMAIVAHELGHALQDRQGYAWLRMRSGIVGFANIGSQIGSIMVFIGILLAGASRSSGALTIAWIGVLLFSVAVAFTLLTLPVEFNASARAREMLTRSGLVTVEEADGVNQVLNAAALTYIAAAASAVSQLLYFIFLLGGFRKRG